MNVKLNEVNDDVKAKVKPDKVNDDVKYSTRLVIIEVDSREQFINKQKFIVREHMLQWVRMEAEKLESDIVIRRSENGSNIWQAFVMMRCKRNVCTNQQFRR